MQIILLEDIPSLGKAGDIVEVAGGYARNYLLPQGKAVETSRRNLRVLEHQKKVVEQKLKRRKKDALRLKEELEGLSLTIAKKVGEMDRLYGSVTTMDIEEALREEGYEIDRKKIDLEEPIKHLGIYTVPVKIHPEVTAQLKVWVVKE